MKSFGVRYFSFGLLYFLSILLWGQSIFPDRTEFQLVREIRQTYSHGKWHLASQLAYSYQSTYDAHEVEVESILISSRLELDDEKFKPISETFLIVNPFSSHAEKVKISLGNYLLRQEKFDEAYQAYLRVDENEISRRSYAAVRYGLALCDFKSGEYESAIAGFQKLTPYKDYFQDAAFYSGYIHYLRENYSDALKTLLKVEGRKEVIPMIANSYAQTRQSEKVIDYAESKVFSSDEETKAILHRLLGNAYFERDNFRLAIRNYEKARELSIVDATVHYRLAFSHESLGRKLKAIQSYKVAALENSEIGQLSAFRLGFMYLDQNDFEYASQSFEKAASLNFSSALMRSAHFLSGKIKVKLQRYDEAINTLEKYLDTYPEDENTLQVNDLLAECWLRSSNYDKVIVHIENLQEISESNRKAYQKATFLKGLNHYNQDQYDAAIRQFNKSFRFRESLEIYSEALYWCGEAYRSLGQNREARNYFTQSLNFQGNTYYQGKYALGYLSYEEDNFSKALEHFTSLKRLDKSHPLWFDANVRIADCHFMLEAFDEAESIYLTLKELGQQQAYLTFQLGWISYHRKAFDKSIALFQAEDLYDSEYYDDALLQIGKIQFEQSNFEISAATFLQLIEDRPQSELRGNAMLRRGLALTNEGSLKAAEEILSRVVEDFPSQPYAQDAILALQEIEKKGYNVVALDELIEKFKNANPDSGSIESIDFERIKTLYFSGEYKKMPLYVEDFLRDHPNSNFKPDVQYYLADGYYQSSNFKSAVAVFDSLMLFPSYDYYNRVLDKRGKSLMALSDFQEALSNYHLLLKNAKNPKEKYLGLEGLLLTHFELDSDSILYFADEILAGEWIPLNGDRKVKDIKMEFHKGKEEWGEMAVIAEELKSGSDVIGAKAFFYSALALAQNERYEDSNETLFELIRSFGNFPDWTGKAYLALVDNYLDLGEVLQAEATNNSILENADQPALVAQAESNLARIELAKKELIEITKDTILQSIDDTLR